MSLADATTLSEMRARTVMGHPSITEILSPGLGQALLPCWEAERSTSRRSVHCWRHSGTTAAPLHRVSGEGTPNARAGTYKHSHNQLNTVMAGWSCSPFCCDGKPPAIPLHHGCAVASDGWGGYHPGLCCVCGNVCIVYSNAIGNRAWQNHHKGSGLSVVDTSPV
jgi:hypothetical protein